jgi:hypothetical protein
MTTPRFTLTTNASYFELIPIYSVLTVPENDLQPRFPGSRDCQCHMMSSSREASICLKFPVNMPSRPIHTVNLPILAPYLLPLVGYG